MCWIFICYCRVACARPAREHDSSIFVYLAPFWRVSCFVCVIAFVVDMRTREVGGGGGGGGGGRAVCDRSVESGVLHGLVVVRVFIVKRVRVCVICLTSLLFVMF